MADTKPGRTEIIDNNSDTAAKELGARNGPPQHRSKGPDGAGQKHSSAGDTQTETNSASRQQSRQALSSSSADRNQEMLTEEQFCDAISNKRRLPCHLLPWSNEFARRYGKEGQSRYQDVRELMVQYAQAMRERVAAQQQEKAELNEYLRVCRAQWRRDRRKEQGKKMRGCRGQGQQRKQSRAARSHAAAAATLEPQQGTGATAAAHRDPATQHTQHSETEAHKYTISWLDKAKLNRIAEDNPCRVLNLVKMLYNAMHMDLSSGMMMGMQATGEWEKLLSELNEFQEFMVSQEAEATGLLEDYGFEL